MKKYLILLFITSFTTIAKAQFSNDVTDSLANELKQYTIKIDVGNGNIYLPVKKKNKNEAKPLNFAKRLPFVQPDKYQTLRKDTVIGNVVRQIVTGVFKLTKDTIDNNHIKYLVEGRYLKPRVGSFIKLEFINVPRDVDVNASVDFQDKNQEGASAFNNVLSKYQASFQNGVERDTARINAEIKKTENQIKETTALLTKEVDNISAINDLNGQIKKLDFNFKSTLADFNKIIKDLRNGSKDGNKISIVDSTLDDILDTLSKIKIPDSLNQNQRLNKIKDLTSSIKKPVSDLKKNLENSGDLLKSLEQKTNDTKKALGDQEDEIKTTKKAIEKKVDSLFKSIRIKDSLYKSLYDSIYLNRSIKIIPFQVANTDLSVINLQFTRKGQVYAEREILLKNKFGFKLDFSTGFVGTTLRDDNYRLYNRNDSSAIIDDPKGQFAVGFAFMAHAYFRTGNRINVALTSGFALNGSNQTVNYILGAAIPLGLEQRFIISAGVLFGKVKKLSAGYNISGNVDSLSVANSASYLKGNSWYKNIQNTGVPLTEKWSNGFYFGITYNLGSLIGNSQKKSFRVN
jgi:predicted  nucleic acid-binding Zn-ribbon protein